MENPENSTANTISSLIAIIVFIVLVVLAVVGIALGAANAPRVTEEVWDEQMILGNKDAKNHFIIYSDLVCPYCVAFENAMVENHEELNQYLADNDILLEIRMTDFLYEYGQHAPINSRYSAVATYCARDEGKFWDYYDKAITTVWNDFFKSSGKNGVSAMASLDKSYWINIGKEVGLSNSFATCVKNDTPIEEIESVAGRMYETINGMPYFKFNNFTASGFDMSWGWDRVKDYFKSGLKS